MVHLPGSGGVHGEDELQGFNPVLPGKYHVVCSAADQTFERANSLIFDFQIMAGTVGEERGKTHKEYVSVSESAVKRPLKLALAAGLITPAQLGQAADLDIDFDQLVGRQLIVEIEPHSYEKIKADGTKQAIETTRISFLGFHRLGSADVESVPLDPAAIKLLGGGSAPVATAPPEAPVPPATQAPPVQASPAQAPPTQAPPAQAPPQDWSNL